MNQIGKIFTEKSSRFEFLDCLRGVAAYAVMVGHATAVIFGPSLTIVPRKGLAVVFFFMLSGFVITFGYEKRLRNGMRPSDFMLQRAIRLYPMIFIANIFAGMWFFLTEKYFGFTGAVAVVLGFFCLPAPYTTFSFGRFPINPPQWSLFFEMMAYCSFAYARLSDKILWMLVVFSLIVYILIDFSYFDKDIPIYFMIFEVMASFYGGVLLFHFYVRSNIRRIYCPGWALSVALIAICIFPKAIGPIFDFLAMVIFFPAMIILGAMNHQPHGRKIDRFLGDLSFPIYILHWPVILVMHRYLVGEVDQWMIIILICAATTLFAWIFLRYVDEPLRRWLTNRLVRRVS